MSEFTKALDMLRETILVPMAQKLKERGVKERGVLGDLRKPGGEIAPGQGRKKPRVTQAKVGRLEGADEVFTPAPVDAALATQPRVCLREERRRHQAAAHAAHPNRRRKSRHIADESAADGDDRALTIDAHVEKPTGDGFDALPALGFFALADFDDGKIARKSIAVQRTDRRVCHDDA